MTRPFRWAHLRNSSARRHRRLFLEPLEGRRVLYGDTGLPALPDSYSLTEDTTLTISAPGILANDSGTSAVLIGDGPQHGSLSFAGDGSFSYTPNADYFGPDSFLYQAIDGVNASGYIEVLLTVDGVNDPPVLGDDSTSIAEDATLTGNVIANDTDPDGDPLTGTVFTWPVNGQLTWLPDGSFTYQPNPNFGGVDVIVIAISDGTLTEQTTMTITVDPVNDPPVAVDHAHSTSEDTPLIVYSPSGLLAGASDPDNDVSSLTPTIVAQPASGNVQISTLGSFVYTPNTGFTGSDSFTFLLSDGTNDSNVATVTIQVTPGNDPPVAVDDAFTLDEDALYFSGDVLTNDSDPDGPSLAVSLMSNVSNGNLILHSNGSFNYTPNPNYFGSDSFAYQVSDGTLTATATVTLTIAAVNDAPIATDDSFAGDEDTPITGSVIGNDFDPDEEPLGSVSLVTTPAHGSVTLDSSGSFTYTPDANYFGADSFTYFVYDITYAQSFPATVHLTINPINDAPTAQNQSYTLDEDTPYTIDGVHGLLTGATDPENDPLSVIIIDHPLHGTVTLNPDGGFTYTPPADYHGTDSFFFGVSDGSLIATATASLSILDDIPYISVSNGSATEGDAIVFAVTLSEPSDLEVFFDVATIGDTAREQFDYVSMTQSYTFAPGETEYLVTVQTLVDQRTDEGIEQMYLDLSLITNAIGLDTSGRGRIVDDYLEPEHPSDGQIIAHDQQLSVDENTSIEIVLSAIDPEDDPLTYHLIAYPLYGELVGEGPTFTYSPFEDVIGRDSFTFEATDGNGYSNVAEVIIDIIPSPSDPSSRTIVANIVSGSITEGSSVLIEGTVIAESEFLPTEVEVWDDVTQNLLGTVITSASGSFTFSHVVEDDNPTVTPSDDIRFLLSAAVESEDVTTTIETQVTNVAPDVSVKVVDPLAPETEIAEIENGGWAMLVVQVLADPGSTDLHRVQVDWGDGESPEWFDISEIEAGVKTLRITRQFDELEGPFDAPTREYDISLIVTDDDGGEVPLAAGLTMLLAAPADLPELELSATDTTADELPFKNDQATFLLTRTGAPHAVRAYLKLLDNAYKADFDAYVNGARVAWTPSGYRVDIPAGVGSVEITIKARMDGVQEPTEHIDLEIAASTFYTRGVDYQDDFDISDSYGLISLSPSLDVILEDANRTLQGGDLGNKHAATVIYTSYGTNVSPIDMLRFDGSADLDVDFSKRVEPFSSNGQPGSYVYQYTVFLFPNADPEAEGDETARAYIYDRPELGFTGVPGKHEVPVTIREDDTYTLSVTPAVTSVGETGGPVAVVVTREGGSNKWPVDLKLQFQGTATNGIDFSAGTIALAHQPYGPGANGPLSLEFKVGAIHRIQLKTGESTYRFTVDPRKDNIPEPLETTVMSVAAPNSPSDYCVAYGSINIIDQDRPDHNWQLVGTMPTLPTPNFGIAVVGGVEREWVFYSATKEWMRLKVDYHWVALTATPVTQQGPFSDSDKVTFYLETATSTSFGLGIEWGVSVEGQYTYGETRGQSKDALYDPDRKSATYANANAYDWLSSPVILGVTYSYQIISDPNGASHSYPLGLAAGDVEDTAGDAYVDRQHSLTNSDIFVRGIDDFMADRIVVSTTDAIIMNKLRAP